jgi:hypothetical protein
LFSFSATRLSASPQRCFNQFTIFAHQRCGESVLAAIKVMPKAAFVANPYFVDGFILARHNPLDFWPVRVPMTVLQPTPQWLHTLGMLVISQARAPKRKSRVVSAPTGQISAVLPE